MLIFTRKCFHYTQETRKRENKHHVHCRFTWLRQQSTCAIIEISPFSSNDPEFQLRLDFFIKMLFLATTIELDFIQKSQHLRTVLILLLCRRKIEGNSSTSINSFEWRLEAILIGRIFLLLLKQFGNTSGA